MPPRRLRAQHLATSGDLKPLGHCFACFASRDWLRHRARKITGGWLATTDFCLLVAAPLRLFEASILGSRRNDPPWQKRVIRHLPSAVLLEHCRMSEVAPKKPHIVIIGGGVGGLEAAKKLSREPVQVTVID